ncbi:MAG: histidine kinase [Sphingobacteriales bacterium]|nr:histidine kinase [Sphingobacteriales bacterium]
MKLKWLILFLLLPVLCKAQRQTIDSLANILSSLKDSSRIDCLNKLALEYYINALPESYINVQTDSAVSFATKAYDESEKIGYTKGVADALQNFGEIARDRSDYITAEKYFRQSVPLFEKLHAAERYSWANLTLGWSLHQQCKFSEAKLAYERAMLFCITADNKERQSMLLRLISYTYGVRGYNEKAFEYMLKAIRITFIIRDPRGVISSPENMAGTYKSAGDIENALLYYRIAAQNAKSVNNPVRYNRILGDMCVLQNQLDSAVYYYNLSDDFVSRMTTDTSIRKRFNSYKLERIGWIYFTQKKYEQALENFKSILPFFEKGNEKISVMRILGALGKCYQVQQNFTKSSPYAKRLLQMALETGARPFERDADELYWKIYDGLGKTDSAYKYNLKYTALKDSIMSDEYRRNIAVSEMKAQDEQQKVKIGLLQKDQQLSKEKLSLQQKEIKNESLLRNVLIAGIAVFILAAFFIFRYIVLKRKNEKQRLEQELKLQQLQTEKNKIEFQQQAAELEMQALRAQMNPHFIFNCLSSINRFILINKIDEASDYLTKFSRLIRMALHNSEKSLITLENELEALRLYLDLERLRFKNAFNYSITFINTIDINSVYIPPMLIQPFAENAIWHGLMHKKGTGNLEIQLCAEDKTLTCIIIDNGIGRNMAAALNSRSAEKNKSMGVEITTGRLALLNKSKNEAALFNIEDLMDEEGNGCGTKVILTMPYRDLTEVVV